MRPHILAATEPCFSLVCYDCDAGMNVGSEQQAVSEGWSDIDYAPNLPQANYVGLCPDCKERFEHWNGN
jgi:hypothetical protein